MGYWIVNVDNYTIQKELSRGPITTVFLATQEALDRSVLLKILNVQWKGEKDLVERFRREAKICARLKHPNIINIFDFGTSQSSFFLAMEYVEGWNLSDFIKQHHPIPLDVILFILLELLKGIQYAHAQGVIHRDIKPANIMIGKDGSVKISDFGLATIADFPSLTEMGSTVGTPAYMSPEQAQGRKLNPDSDLFSMGTTVYEMVCGENPFLGENLADSIQLILTKKQIPLDKKRQNVPEWFSELVQVLLEKNPQRRTSSVAEIIQKLKSQANIADQAAFANFIKEPSSHKTEKVKRGDSHKLLSRKPSVYIFSVLLALAVIVIFFLSRIAETDNPNLVSNSFEATGNNSADSVLAVNQQNLDRSNQAAVTKKTEVITDSFQVKPHEDSQEDLKGAESNSKEEQSSTNLEMAPGGVFISTYPWAKIYINEKYYETTPLKGPITLEAGNYMLKLENPNFNSIDQEITVQSGFIDTMSFNLEPAIGFLEIQVIPWAEVYINGEYKETTPLNKPISLLAGRYELKLINQNFSTWTDSIKIEAGQTFTKQVSLVK